MSELVMDERAEPAEPAVRFGVLGPLRAWRDGRSLDLGPPYQRVVLALLLLHAGRPVSPEQLFQWVWRDDEPRYARNLVQKRVSRLRTVLGSGHAGGGAGQPLLAWDGMGYVCTLAQGCLDLHVFDSKLARARAARAAGDLPAAAEALHAALDLWRGPAFDGLANPVLDAHRDSLHERRITVTEDRIEIDLALESPGDLIPELRHLVAEHPLRERLRGQLMLALYRSGRKADALAAFEDARRYLHDELQAQPDLWLRRLHQRILVDDPHLYVASGAGDRAGRWQQVPAQLPHRMPYFAGRDSEVAQLDAMAAIPDGPGIVAITGPAGIGKTALALHWGHRTRDRYPDGQLYVNLRGFDPTDSVVETGDAIRGFLGALGVPAERIPAGVDAKAALYRTVLAGRRVLVLLDNARDAEHVRPLVPGTPSCLVLVTSRDQLASLVATDGGQVLGLDLPSAAEARSMLAARLTLNRVVAEPAAVEDIVACCARLPLALAIVAGRAAVRPKAGLAQLAEELLRMRGGLDAFAGQDASTDARAVFSWSYRQLSGDAARLFRLLGTHPTPDLSEPAAASLAGVAEPQLAPALTELLRTHLVTVREPGRLTLHDLVRAYAGEQSRALDTEDDRQAAACRLADHYLHTAYAAARRLDPHREPIPLAVAQQGVTLAPVPDEGAALAWFTAEQAGLPAVQEWAAAHGFDGHVWRLAWTMVPFHDRAASWYDSATAQRAGLEAAWRLADPLGQAVMSRSLARACGHLGRYGEARDHLYRALNLFERMRHVGGQADTHLSLARLSYREGRIDAALEHARCSQRLYAEVCDASGRARATNALGWFHTLLGDPRRALSYCDEALALQVELGDRVGEASTLDSLGYAHHHLDQYDQAVVLYERALDVWRDLGDRYNEAETLNHLGDTCRSAGAPERGRDAWRRALAILDQLGHADAHHVRMKLANAG